MSCKWMQDGNIRLVMYVAIAIMPQVIADLSKDDVTWLTGAVVLASALTAAKAFMSNPDNPPTLPAVPPVVVPPVPVQPEVH